MRDPQRSTSRRDFLRNAAASAVGGRLALGAGPWAIRAPGDRVRVAVIGTGGRGESLATSFARLPTAEVVYVCDVDSRRRDAVTAAVAKLQTRAPKPVTDLRRTLESRDVDAVVIATPDHWQTPATLLALDAGKHVYVEKPGSHNGHEAELIAAAATRSGRAVQMGNQRRSWPGVVEGIERVRGGAIGPVHYSRGWYANGRDGIGQGKRLPVPQWLDYELWQGPAPREPYRDNILHYNWHWFWNWGTGEMGNNGVHSLDLCRWGLGVDHPTRVTSTGGRYFWNDDQQTPDTHVVTMEFPGEKQITWEGLSSNRAGVMGNGFGASFHGEGGTVIIEGLGYRILDRAGKVTAEVGGRGDGAAVATTGPGFDIDAGHLTNFTAAIQKGEPLRSPVQDGQRATLLCHLGNLAQRLGHDIAVDPATGRPRDMQQAQRFWRRDYAPGWAPTT